MSRIATKTTWPCNPKFGSQEWLLNYYGVKDIDYKFDDSGKPVPTDQGRAELTATWRYITSPPYALFANPTESNGGG